MQNQQKHGEFIMKLLEAPTAFLFDDDDAIFRCNRELHIQCQLDGTWQDIQWLSSNIFESTKWEIRTAKKLLEHLQKGGMICNIDDPDASWRLVMEYQSIKAVDHAPYNVMYALKPEEWKLI